MAQIELTKDEIILLCNVLEAINVTDPDPVAKFKAMNIVSNLHEKIKGLKNDTHEQA